MGKSQPSSNGWQYYQTVACIVCRGPIKRIRRMWADDTVVYDDRPEVAGWAGRPIFINPVDPSTITHDNLPICQVRRPSVSTLLDASKIFIYLGTQSQLPDPALQAIVGTANCPAYRGRVLVVLKDLGIHNWGGRVPNLSFEVESAEADGSGKVYVVDILGSIFDMVGNPDAGIPGIATAARDFSQLAGVQCDGMVLAQRGEARQHVAPLQDAFQFDMVDADFTLRAVKRGQSSIGTINWLHMGAGTPDPQTEPFKMTRGQQLETPQRCDVLYQSAGIDFQNFTQSTTREATLVRKSLQLSLPVVMSESSAMAIARQRLAMAQLQRDTIQLAVPFNYISWLPGDVVTVPLSPTGDNLLCKITKQTIGLFGHIEMTLVPDDPDIYTLTGEGAAPPGGGGGGVASLYPPIVWAADLPALVNQPDASFDGCSLITLVGSARGSWPGAHVQCNDGSGGGGGGWWGGGGGGGGIQDTSGNTQQLISANTVSGAVGTLTANLAGYTGPDEWDTTSIIHVQMKDVYLAAASAGGANHGNGTIVMQDPSTAGGAFQGTYSVQMTGSGSFNVYDPLGSLVGSGSTGSVFANEVVFQINTGSTAFQSGDVFNIVVTPSGLTIGTPPTGATDADIYAGLNICVVEGEVIQFVSAIDNGNNNFTLSRLLRGRRGTGVKGWSGHAAGATIAFVMPPPTAPQRFKANLAEVGNTHMLHAFDTDRTGLSYSNTPFCQVTMEGNARKPWPPSLTSAARTAGAGSNIALAWTYSSRWGDELAAGGSGVVPLGETAETYDLEIWNTSFTTRLRLVSGLTSGSWTYTAAMQTADLGSTSAAFIAVLYQTSSVVGRGYPARELLSV